MMQQNIAALKVDRLSKSFAEKEVVKKVSFEISPGEIFGLLGPNGAGKSTMINMICGVCQIDSGRVQVFGHDNQTDFAITRRTVGVMHQEVVADVFFTIEQALKIYPGYYGVKLDKEWRDHLIDRLVLRPHLKKRMNKLSGGMKRRFMVAKALIHKPKLLILDEPTAGVDVELRRSLWEFVKEINAAGTAILLTTHYLEEAEEMCDRIAIMNHGNIIAMDKTANLNEKIEEKRVQVQLNDALDVMPDSLMKLGCELSENRKQLSFAKHDNYELNDFLKTIYDLDLQVLDIENKHASLEEVFLKLTGKVH